MSERAHRKRTTRGGELVADHAERRKQGYALNALNAHSANVSPDVRSRLGCPDPDDAIREQIDAIDEGRPGVHRLLVLDALVKRAGRGPKELDSAKDLMEALVRQADVPTGDHDSAVATVRGALDSVAARRAIAPASDPWPTFARQAARALRLTPAEVEKPRCNDREVVKKRGREAIGVTVEFFTDVAPAEMTVCDPTRWYECTASFHKMTPWNHPDAVSEERPNGWRRDLVETLDFLPDLTLETPLRFTYSIDDAPDPSWMHLDYVLLEDTEEIAVDEGAIDVRRVTAGEHVGRTRVSAKKAIAFKDELLAKWPTVACDTFWTDLVVHAAVGRCGGERA